MRILYAIQGTGNGHLSRAKEIIPHLQARGDLDILVSGTQANVSINYPIAFQKHGFSFVFGQNGGIDLLETLRIFKPVKLWNDIKCMHLEQYDLVINDFEPLTAWACKKIKKRSVSISHQAAFQSSKVPKAKTLKGIGEFVLKNYAPLTDYIGLHFENYDESIFTPIIRTEIRDAESRNGDHILVYLPAYGDEVLTHSFRKVRNVNFKIYSKHSKEEKAAANVQILPVGQASWIDDLTSSSGVIMGAGFEGPSEALYLGKKLMVVPMFNQYEQLCNALALKQMGIKVLSTVGRNFHEAVEDWLADDFVLKKDYPNQCEQIINQAISLISESYVKKSSLVC